MTSLRLPYWQAVVLVKLPMLLPFPSFSHTYSNYMYVCNITYHIYIHTGMYMYILTAKVSRNLLIQHYEHCNLGQENTGFGGFERFYLLL